ncbi:solute carrier family 2, facilitated glucose transporter member 1-like isoform X2 [Tubulanus polymorphus]|uniref:solute carrier family 2, facilitated glucose transporter member 1-like isoform X2 n=1 Tax=Tubulanus polymorphus TaxID=672921 RepID=UPI003DA5BBF8
MSSITWVTSILYLPNEPLECPHHYKGRLTISLAITAFVTVLGSSFPHGYNTGVLNIQEKYIKTFINESWIPADTNPSNDAINMVWSVINSIYLAAGCIGALSAGWLANKFGRKKSLIGLHVFGIVGSMMFALCRYANSYIVVIIARFLVGIACGAETGLVPMYLTEISPINIRGAMGVLHQLALTSGIFVAQIFGLNAILALKFFRGPQHDVTTDIQEMELEAHQMEQEPPWTFSHLFATKELRLQLVLVSCLALAQQLSGINVVFYYSTGVFRDAQIPDEYTQYATLSTGFINVLMTGISVPLMEKSGRRPLLLSGMVLMIMSASVIVLCLGLQHIATWLSYLTILCMILFVIGFAIGLGSIPQFIGAELFKQGPRPPAMSFAGMLNWLANFLVAMLFPIMQSAMMQYVFLVFIAITVLFVICVWQLLPETKNKSYDEIYKEFHTPYSKEKDNAERTMDGAIGKRLANHDDGLTLDVLKNDLHDQERHALIANDISTPVRRTSSTRRGSTFKIVLPSILNTRKQNITFHPLEFALRPLEDIEDVREHSSSVGRRATIF